MKKSFRGSVKRSVQELSNGVSLRHPPTPKVFCPRFFIHNGVG